MASVKKVVSKLDRGYQTALFCAFGLCMSLAIVLTYDLRISDAAWV
jgi:hypothetical protein